MSATERRGAPLVSVVIPTFQHERFIEAAIRSAATQITSFEVEILVGEDGSSDATPAICDRLAREYPDQVTVHRHGHLPKVFIRGRQTGRRNLVETLARARGKYVALLEGDDLWTDRHKLETQVRFLERNPAFGFCFHDVRRETTEGALLGYIPATHRLTFDTAALLARYQVPTASVVLRRAAIPTPLPDWYVHEAPVGDFPLLLLVSLSGPGRRLPRVMASYRVGGGLWSSARETKRLLEVVETRSLLARHLPPEHRPNALRQLALSQLDWVLHLCQDGSMDEALRTWTSIPTSHLRKRDASKWAAGWLALRGVRAARIAYGLRAASATAGAVPLRALAAGERVASRCVVPDEPTP